MGYADCITIYRDAIEKLSSRGTESRLNRKVCPLNTDANESRQQEERGRGHRGYGGRHPSGGRGRGRSRGYGGDRRYKANRGDVRAAVLALLAERPMHGYEMMQELSERSKGAWQPSPGSIYPTLQQLADEGLVTSSRDDGRNIFGLTDTGRAAYDETTTPPPWENLVGTDNFVSMRRAASGVMGATKQVAQVGSAEQVTAATEILTEARQKLYQLLAE